MMKRKEAKRNENSHGVLYNKARAAAAWWKRVKVDEEKKIRNVSWIGCPKVYIFPRPLHSFPFLVSNIPLNQLYALSWLACNKNCKHLYNNVQLHALFIQPERKQISRGLREAIDMSIRGFSAFGNSLVNKREKKKRKWKKKGEKNRREDTVQKYEGSGCWV